MTVSVSSASEWCCLPLPAAMGPWNEEGGHEVSKSRREGVEGVV